MFANSDRNTKRRIAGYLGGVLGATCVLLAVYPGIAAAAPALDKLTLTSMCTLPNGDAVFRVGNTNAVSISYTWDINKTGFSGGGSATPGNTYLHVPSSDAGNTRLFVDGKQQATKAQNGDLCVFHVQPVKQWLDGSGAAIPSPDAPKGWKLIFEGELETVTCTWTNKDVLSCKSKVNPDAKGTFANEGSSLEVPFGGSYTITETATPAFEQDGTGKFGPLDQPADLDAYFEGADTLDAVVTNQSSEVSAPTTTVSAATTEAPTTTLAPTTTVAEPTTTIVSTTTTVDEPTTTTTVDEPTTTTTVEEPTTTTTVEEPTTTTTVEEPTTTTTVEEATTTTTVEEATTTTTVEEATTTTTVDEPTKTTVDEPTTTIAPLTTESPTTTLAPSGDERAAGSEATSTTSGPTTTQGTPAQLPQGEDLTVRSADVTNDPGAGVAPAHDTLPVTGVAAGALTILGLALVAVGLVVVALGRRRLV